MSYLSVPLFLLFDTEYVKSMLRPIFKFADHDVRVYDFAPHDVGRYPYAWDQVYGINRKHLGSMYSKAAGRVRPSLYNFPQAMMFFDFTMQMPVGECGNMPIMTAAVCMLDGNAEFAKPYTASQEKWVQYLITSTAQIPASSSAPMTLPDIWPTISTCLPRRSWSLRPIFCSWSS